MTIYHYWAVLLVVVIAQACTPSAKPSSSENPPSDIQVPSRTAPLQRIVHRSKTTQRKPTLSQKVKVKVRARVPTRKVVSPSFSSQGTLPLKMQQRVQFFHDILRFVRECAAKRSARGKRKKGKRRNVLRKRYKLRGRVRNVASLLGPAPRLKKKDDCYQLLTRSNRRAAIGTQCGFIGSDNRKYNRCIRRFVRLKKKRVLRALLRSKVPETRWLAGLGLILLARKAGVPLHGSDQRAISLLSKQEGYLWSCGGCIYNYEPHDCYFQLLVELQRKKYQKWMPMLWNGFTSTRGLW